MRVAATAILSVMLANCGETRKPVGIDVQSNDSTVKSDQSSADASVTPRKGFVFTNPATGLQIPVNISVPAGAEVRIGFRLEGVRRDDYTIGYAKGSSDLLRLFDRTTLSGKVSSSPVTYQLVARNTRACAEDRSSSSSSNGQRKAVDDASNLRCDITGVEVTSVNLNYDITGTLTINGGGVSPSGL